MFPNECCMTESGCCCGLAEPRPVEIVCEACGGEGRVLRGQYEDERDCGPCPYCDRGLAYVPAEPITEADLRQIDEEAMAAHNLEAQRRI